MNAKHLTIAAALLAAPLLAVLAQPALATTYSESISSITSSTMGQPSFSGLAHFSNNTDLRKFLDRSVSLSRATVR